MDTFQSLTKNKFSEKTEEVNHYEELMHKAVNKLVDQYWKFINTTKRQPMALTQNTTVWQVYLKWHQYFLELRDIKDFAGINKSELDPNNQQINSQGPPANEIELFEKFIQLKGVNWELRISNKANNKIRFSPNQKAIILAILSLQLGFMSDAEHIETGPILYLAGFSKKIIGNQSIIFAVVPERVPVTVFPNDLIGFSYRQHLRIIDIVQSSDVKQKNLVWDNFQYHFQGDPDKWNAFQASNFLEQHSERLRSDRELLDISNIVKINGSGHKTKYSPGLSSFVELKSQERKMYQLVGSRWVAEEEQSKLSWQVTPNVKQQNRVLIESCTSQASCEWLLKFLQKIPNLNLGLTTEEELLISTPGNILCLGRSGTGKTTSAVLRLFALEILFKIRSSLQTKDKQSLQAVKLSSEQAESATGLHSIIVTASPVLTNEIRRYYNSMKTKIINELKIREAKRKAKEMNSDISPDNQQQNDLVEEIKEEKQGKTEEVDNLDVDDEMMDADEIEKNFNVPQSMKYMQNSDFPAFLSVKRLVYMIDASLRKPFFARNVKNQIIGMDSQAEWHNEQKGILMINNYYKNKTNLANEKTNKDYIDNFMELSSSSDEEGDDEQDSKNSPKKTYEKKQAVIEGESVVQEFAQEIDYETFERKFWPKFSQRFRNLSCSATWTEIYSVIKGSANSNQFIDKGISLENYQQLSSKRTFITADEKKQIYQVYSLYEQWKTQVKGFDFMDLVNYILREISAHRYFGVPIHFMMVDEVQDLTAATIMLLINVTEQNLYFAGDTAQTIAKGVGFKFADLKNMLSGNNNFAMPKVLQLTVNFRSHNQILNLANSVISALELLFPSTIDKLLKEKSKVNGLKPIVLDSSLLESLFFILSGQNSSQSQNQKNALTKDKADFGCDQVIIVRDQDAKKLVPSVLQHALCLTVYEAKGLEFEDVILYNFFTDSKCHEQWVVLNDIQVEEEKQIKQLKPKMQNLDDLEFENIEKQDEQKIDQSNVKYEYTKKFFLSHIRQDVQKEYNTLCNELKQLYVCITRPKKRLIIYDEEPQSRDVIMKFWSKVNAVDVITEEMIKNSQQNSLYQTKEQKALFEQLLNGSNQNSSEENIKGWRAQGIKMLQRRFYEQAIKCFEHSGDEMYKKRSQGYQLAETAAKYQSESDTIGYRLSDSASTFSKKDKREMKEQLKNKHDNAIDQFEKAAQVFIEINLKKQAAQCLYTAENYLQSANLFEEVGLYAQAGEAYYNLGEYSKAAQLYNEGKIVTKAIECYKKQKNWDAILNCIKVNKNEFTQQQREELIYKYVPLALNSLYVIMTNDNADKIDEDDEEDQKSQIKISQIIQENSDEEDEDDENDQQQDQHEGSSNENQLEESDSIQISCITESNGSEKNQIIQINTQSKAPTNNQKSPPKALLIQSYQDDFSIISQSDIQSTNNNILDSFEHLSQFDLEDEFIKSRSISIIDSIISGDYKKYSQKSEMSDYSVIELPEDNPTNQRIMQSVNVIQTKRDIYAEDQMMTKIIFYVCQFSKDVRSHLANIRSKDALLSVQHEVSNIEKQEEDLVQIDTNREKDFDYFDIDIDNMDDSFINILLDCLESFELYKLCLLVCNRYHLKERIGRYLVSIAYKYSNTYQLRKNFTQFFHQAHKEVQQQVSFIAHQAFHGALELVDPKYLQIKNSNEPDSQNQMSKYCNTALLNQGFWKKLVYMMDIKSCISVTNAFGDYYNSKLIYLGFYKSDNMEAAAKYDSDKIKNIINDNNFEFLGSNLIPNDEIQELAFKFALDSVVQVYNNDLTKPINFAFPVYFQMTEIALKLQRRSDQNELEYLISNLNKRVINIYSNKPVIDNLVNQLLDQNQVYQQNLYIYDSFVAVFILIQNAFKDKPSAFTNILSNLNQALYLQMLKIIQITMLILQSKNIQSNYQSKLQVMIMGMLSVLSIKHIQTCDGLYDNNGDKVIIYYKSPLALEITQQLDVRKKIITEKITQNVFDNPEIKFLPKSEVNKRIKSQLRDALYEESQDSLIEVIDLDGNFLRAPLKLIIENILPKLEGYIKRGAQSKLKQTYIIQKQEIDDFESPFYGENLLQKLILTYQSSFEASKIFYPAKQILLQVFEDLENKIKQQQLGSLEYHNMMEKNLQKDRVSDHQQYLVELGLMSQAYIERKNQKALKSNIKAQFLIENLRTSANCLTLLAFLSQKPLLSFKFNKNIVQEIAYKYLTLFLRSNADEQRIMEYALISFSLYTLSDDYLQFMQIIQKQLGAKSPERIVLFNLLDMHIYKQCGDLLSASENILVLLENIKIYDLTLDIYYQIILLQQALVLAFSAGGKPHFYIPFELTKYLNHYFDDIKNDDKNEFLNQLDKLNQGEDIQVELKLTNMKYSQAKQKYSKLLSRIIRQLHSLTEKANDPYSYHHLFLITISILINEPEAGDQNNDKIKDCFQQFAENEIISYDSQYFEYESFQYLQQEFLSLDSQGQNSFIYNPNKGESVFVSVLINTAESVDSLKKIVQDKLISAEVIEAEKLQQHQALAELLKPIIIRYKENEKKQKENKKMPSQTSKSLPFESQLVLNSLNIQESQYKVSQNAIASYILEIDKVVKFINLVSINSTYEGVIDLHYLLQQKHKIEVDFISRLANVIKGNEKLSKLQIDEMLEKVAYIKEQVEGWSKTKRDSTGQQRMIEKNQKIMKLKWREHALKAKQKAMMKLARKNKLESLEKKRERMQKYKS